MQDILQNISKNTVIQPKLEFIRDGIGEGLVEVGLRYKNSFVVCADLAESTRASMFLQKFPQRFVEVGVSEQNLIGVSVGLSMTGKIAFAISYAVFSPSRTFDQIRVNVCYNNANVKIIGGHAGLVTGGDGATHQSLEDIAITRVLPNMTVIVPCDKEQAKKAILESARYIGPVYIRSSREKSATITSKTTPFEIGVAQVMSNGDDVLIVACGLMVYEALVANEALIKDGISCSVVNIHTIKPIDKKTLIYLSLRHRFVVVCEEHQINGGLFGAVTEALAEVAHPKILSISVKDSFGESGEPFELLKKYGLNSQNIINTIKNNFSRNHFSKEKYICEKCSFEYEKKQKCVNCGNPKSRCVCC